MKKIHGFKVKDLIGLKISNEDILNKIENTYKKLYNNKFIFDLIFLVFNLIFFFKI